MHTPPWQTSPETHWVSPVQTLQLWSAWQVAPVGQSLLLWQPGSHT
jgi:hypothetical protein